ncbi:MAG TPA: right-handed parallel beta-helix repeat-containing protein, partial [Gemmataceae bacterium]|nr:right-handed parallel beta-helix repeat-containing protein [Gemmataceae bacterium]
MASLAFRLAWRGTRSVSGKSRLRVKPRERHNRLCLEWLEHRCLPSTVTTLADDGPGSLRVALTTTQPGGTVDFLPGLIGTITVAQRLEIDHNLAIAGPGAGVITISGNSSVQVFHIASSATVRVSGLTITNGFTGQNGGGIFNEGTLILSDCTVSGNRAQSDGGGINNTGTLIVSNCTLSNNGGTRQDGEADTQRGGGIYNTGTLTISTSTLAGNNANANGAGLCNRGTLTVNSTTLSDNGRLTTVLDPRGFAEAIPSHGGGIYNDGTLMVTNSTLSGNSADDAGGGIYNQGALSVLNSTLSGNGGMNAPDGNAIANNFLGTLTVRNTTFSDNGLTYGAVGSVLRNDGVSTVENSTFSRNKGYLGALDNTGSLTITNSTFYRNQSTEGGAIVNDADNGRVGTLAVSDTTFAGNTASSMDHGTFHGSALSIRAGTAMLRNSIFQGSQGDNLYVTGGAVLSQGYNLSNDDGSGFLTDFTDLIHTDPLLGPLQDNGGPTQTVALLPRSPALNTGDPTVINTADQRGVFRTGGANRGAYEASASSLSLAGLAATNTLCVPTGFSVMAKDLFGQPAVGYRGTVHFTSSGRASLPEDYTFTAADGGMHTFQATFRAVGIQAISVQDTASSALAGTQGDLTIIPAEFSFSEFPFPITAGSPLDCTVTVTDANGNPALGYCDAVQFASSDPLAHLLSNSYTFTAADKGVHLFKHLVTFETVGTDLSLTVTDATTPSLTFTKTDLKVVPSNLILGGFSSDPAIAGSVQNFTVTLQDAYANRAQGYVDTVRFRSDDPQAILPADYAFTTADRGTHTFQVIFKTAGTHALTATDVMAPLLTDTHMSLRIVPAPATTLVFGDFSSAFTKAGTPLSFTVTAKDPYGNQAIGYSGTVQLTSSDGRTALLAAYSFTAADQGQHQFQVTFKTAGAHMLTITDAMDSALTTTQGDLAILPTDPVRLEISTLPVSIIAGAANAFVVTVRDAYGNPVTGYRGTVELTSSDPKAVLPAGYTFTSADQGQHQFQVMFKKAGFRDLTVTDSTAPTLTMTRASILVKPAEPHELAINPPSASTNAGAANAFVITVFDAYGNLATGYEGTLHFASSDPRALVPADHTFTSDDQGAHTFFATFQTAGIQSLIATDTEDPS